MDGHGADHQRHHRVRRDAEREQRDERGLRGGIIRAFRRRHALDRAAAEPRRILGDLLLEGVGRERRDHRAAAGQDAQDRPEDRAAGDRPGRVDQVLARRHQAGDLLADDVAVLGRDFEVADDLRKSEHAHGDVGEADAVRQLGDVEGHAAGAGLEIGADHREQQAGHHHRHGLEHGALGKDHREDQAQHHQREVFRRAEQQRDAGQRGAQRGHQHRRHAAREERADGGDGERGAGAPLARHLVPVKAGDDGCRLTRDVDEHRGGRATVLRSIVDAGEHDERAHRRQAERDRQQHRDRGDGADAGKNADQRPDQRADQAEDHVHRHRDREGRSKDIDVPVNELEHHAHALSKVLKEF